jgi:hypothetical protein
MLRHGHSAIGSEIPACGTAGPAPATFTPDQAIAHCEDWTDALCRSAFPRLMAASHRKTPR